jgi:GT2 family glycosyltransferase
MSTDRLQVEVCTYKRGGELAMLLESLLNQTYKDWDLIVVDDQKEAPIRTQKYINDCFVRIKCEGHGVRYIVQDVRRGIAAARNRAVKEAFPSEFHIRIDDDSICAPDYLEKLMKIMTEGALGIKPEDIGIVGGIVPYFGGPKIYRNTGRLGRFFEEISYVPQGVMMTDNGGMLWTPNKIMLSHHVRSSYIFRKSAWEKAKGFPEETGINVAFREETDFCIKTAYAGYKTIVDTSALCWHLKAPYGGTRPENPAEYQQAIQINEMHFQKKFMTLFQRKGNPFKDW